MGGQFPERVALGLSTEMLRALEKEAKRGGRTVLAQIRHFCTQGLTDASPPPLPSTGIESRLALSEEMNAALEDLAARVSALEAVLGAHRGANKKAR